MKPDFTDPHTVFRKDRIVTGEQRWHAIGWTGVAVLLVVHVYPYEEGRASAPALSATGYGIPPATVSLDQIPVRRLASPTQPAFTLRAEVREARQCLSPRENHVIELLYDSGWQSREVAAELRVNESRVSQIKQRAIAKLRLQLESGSARRAA